MQPAVVLQLAQRCCAGGQDQAVVAMASVLVAEVRPAHEFLLGVVDGNQRLAAARALAATPGTIAIGT
ncbi:MAG: hypothetical protein DI604_26670 [Delftia acidovorans]|nr:MAG: hypothetical protein DI604_26670 [Delftia acidovorans]